MKSVDSQKWLRAIADEFRTIDKHGTWTDASRRDAPKGVYVLPSGIVLRVKRDSQGHVAKYKARLVVRGNFQADGNDYAELYAPVACIELVRLMFAVSVSKGWSIEQMDVKSAFLHAKLPDTDDVWIRLPKVPGVPAANGRVVKLVKSLYGLRQAP